MRLLGITDLNQLNDFFVNTSLLELELPKRIDVAGLALQDSVGSKRDNKL